MNYTQNSTVNVTEVHNNRSIGLLRFNFTVAVAVFILGWLNLTVPVVALKSRHLRDSPFIWILVALACGDFLCSTLATPIHLLRIADYERKFSPSVCYLRITTVMVSVTISLVSITAVALLRVLSTWRPSFKLTNYTVRFLVVIEFSLALVMAAISIQKNSANYTQCVLSRQEYVMERPENLNQSWRIIFALMVICFVVTLGSYVLVFIKLLSRRALFNNQSNPSTSSCLELDTAVITALVTITFSVSYLLGYCVAFLHKRISPNDYWERYDIESLGRTLPFIQSAANPLIYFWKCKSYRKIALDFFLRRNAIVPLSQGSGLPVPVNASSGSHATTARTSEDNGVLLRPALLRPRPATFGISRSDTALAPQATSSNNV